MTLLASGRNRIVLVEILFLLLCYALAGWRGVAINALASVWTAGVLYWLAHNAPAESVKQ